MQSEISSYGNRVWGKIDSYISKALNAEFFNNKAFDPENLKALNRYLVIIIILAAAYFTADIIFTSPARNAISKISGSSASSGARPFTGVAVPVEVKDYSFYSNKVPGRSIFTAAAFTESDSFAGEPADDSVGLVGILPGAAPQAIIEDKKSQQTYYLKKGQTVNGITAEEISEGTVKLDYRGKKMTLLL